LIECDVWIAQAALKFRVTVSEGTSNFVDHTVCLHLFRSGRPSNLLMDRRIR
jgi:hypothetical protein